MNMDIGKVYLVGAGPGDPGLLTVKAQALLRRAEVIILDRLVNPKILESVPAGAEIIYVGKESNRHTVPQDGINQFLVDKAKEGRMVVRLKGGDPFVFGRGGEEAQYLKENGIGFEIVPGVTSAIAAPAYAGIPVTHRDHTSTLTIITGHEKPGKDESSVPWEQIGCGTGTLVFLMGVENLPNIVSNLVGMGRDPATPVALVRWGTYAHQAVLTGSLQDIVQKVKEQRFTPPAVIVVGDVVSLRDELAWFDNRPLFGKKIVVTRSRSQASQLVVQLEMLGAEVIELPTISIQRIVQPRIQQIVCSMESYSWIIFTSVNGVTEFIRQVMELGFDIRDLKGPRICAIGPATAEECSQYGLVVSAVPDEYRAEGVLAVLKDKISGGEKVLLARAKGAREILPKELAAQGVLVDEIEIYEAVVETFIDENSKQLIIDGEVDVVTFTSSSTVKNFVNILGAKSIEMLKNHTKIACIGPITADTAREAGFNIDVIANEFTIEGLVKSLVDYYQ